MSTTIEKAAERIAQLRRAGVDVPSSQAGMDGERVSTASPAPAVDPIAETNPASRDESSREVVIDVTRLAAAGMITPEERQSQISDEFRVIKRPLLENARGRLRTPDARSNLIIVTSALEGEGKTFVAVNLALSIAMEMDYRVLLVDADVRGPSVLSTLGLPTSQGLTDVLTDPSIRLSDVLLRTSLPKLSVLPAGTYHARAAELLASQSMALLMGEMSNRYRDRIIVFDTSPLLAGAESRVLASHAGQVVMVVAADSTGQGAIRQALEALDGCATVMTVLNKAAGLRRGYYARDENVGRAANATQA